LVLEALPGESLPQRLLRDRRYEHALADLAPQCGEILPRLPSISTNELPPLSRPDPLERCRAVLNSLPDAHPAFELILRRLELSRPAPRPATLVHGDFRMGNLLIDERGITAVLDWELVHLGDP